ncbi:MULTISPECIES: LytR/AlgR family response regulator transcription factor [Flavobacterium]|nr:MULTISPECIES: LytTR family DNA-binding domain-containing protein [Flavobacterium]TCN59487.1 LytTR family two component transcriptional regulator [Flavobacterium circumlabens]
MIKCVIIDDEPLAIEIIQTYLERLSDFELSACFTSAVDALTYVQKNKIDLLFLDIEMPLFNGLEFAKTLNYNPAIIMTTAYRDYAVESFELNVVDYLLKPIGFQRFISATSKVIKIISEIPPATEKTDLSNFTGEDEDLWVKVDKKLIRIAINDILYIESLKDYVRVKTKNRELVTYSSLNKILEKLPESKFLRIHKSFIAAVKKIETIEGNRVTIDGKILPLGRIFKEELIKKTQD